MAKTVIDSRDSQFVLFEQLQTDQLLAPDLREEYDLETLKMVVGEAEKVTLNAFAPSNKDGDKLGCRFEDGKVTLPESFYKAYGVYTEGGWNVISDSMEVGGQGLPKTIEVCCRDFFAAGNIALSNYLNLTHGAAKLIEIFGSPEQKEIFLEKMYTGVWCGTMCLTESDAGSDVGATKATAKKNDDGTYSIKGTKVFITGGEHDLTENIVHMVLARVEGDPPGTKGLSLFIVSKYKIKDGALGEPNDVLCTGIEEKMGLHGSSTCTLNFGDEDNCTGYLIGKQGLGIVVMFHMMNEARQIVGAQGLALGGAAYLEALSYAKERLQGPHFAQARNADAAKVPIIEHPDIRYTLMKMKAYIEGIRALVYYHGYCMDRTELAATDEEKAKWHGQVELLTPVCKAYSTDRGFEVCSSAVQVLGGYGYCSEFPVEQYLRDERITAIYEGTNGIQAIDLVGRKIVMKKGQAFKDFMTEVDRIMDQAGSHESLAPYAAMMKEYKTALEGATQFLIQEMSSKNAGLAMAKATKYTELFGDVTLAAMWLWQTGLALEKLDGTLKERGMSWDDFNPGAPPDGEIAFYAGKIQTGKFYLERIMPGTIGKAEEIKSRGEDYLKMSTECF
ncbi:acyl-CoA dehydrogenase [Thermodesulfobacteriota bacterium]